MMNVPLAVPLNNALAIKTRAARLAAAFTLAAAAVAGLVPPSACMGAEPAEINSAVDRGLAFLAQDALTWKDQIVAQQRPDGGWGQSQEMASDAYASGMALYSLSEAGIPANDPAIAAGQAFLIASQEAAGSWPMASRPGGPGGKSAKNLSPISFSGTAWAVMGLMRTSPDTARG